MKLSIDARLFLLKPLNVRLSSFWKVKESKETRHQYEAKLASKSENKIEGCLSTMVSK